MRQVIKYEDNDGTLWNLEKEARLSDDKIILEGLFNECAEDRKAFALDAWTNIAKKSPKVIKALIHVLEIDFTQIRAQEIVDKSKETI